ncbi:hypothetical protein V2J09_020433 [Rumex salicifolius]
MRWKKVTLSETMEICGPGKRWGHTFNAIGGGKLLYLFGGYGRDNCQTNQVHVFDTVSQSWSQPFVQGKPPTPRDSHTCTTVGDFLFVFGGTDGVSGDGPSARFSMAGDCLDPTINGALVFIGGCNKNLEALDDMYFLYTDIVREFARDERRLEKLSLRKQLKMKSQTGYLPASSNNKALVPFGSPDLHESGAYSQQGQQYFHLNDYQPTLGKRTFHAKVTTNLANGFTIETILDGKPLRGILFLDKPFLPMSGLTASRNPSGETDAVKDKVKSNADQEPKTNLSTPKDPKTDTVSASKEFGSSVPNKSEEVGANLSLQVGAGSSVPEKDPNVNMQDHKVDEGLDSNKVCEKNSAVPGDTSIPTSQGINASSELHIM